MFLERKVAFFFVLLLSSLVGLSSSACEYQRGADDSVFCALDDAYKIENVSEDIIKLSNSEPYTREEPSHSIDDVIIFPTEKNKKEINPVRKIGKIVRVVSEKFYATSGDSIVNSFEYMATAIYKIAENSSFTPYVGLGTGIVNMYEEDLINGLAVEDDNIFPAYQLVMGFSYKPKNKNTPSKKRRLALASIDLNYRYFDAQEDLNFGVDNFERSGFDSENHGVNMNVSFKF